MHRGLHSHGGIPIAGCCIMENPTDICGSLSRDAVLFVLPLDERNIPEAAA